METTPAVDAPGPRPPPGSAPRTALSRAQAAVLDAVEAADAPVSLAGLAATTGLHENTLRGHLDALVRAGLVRRDSAPPTGRGRPAILYRTTGRGSGPGTEYAGLAVTLAAALHRSDAAPAESAVTAGAEWGQELARAEGAPSASGPVAARRQVVSVLRRMGFDPRVDLGVDPGHTTVRLTRCPLLDAARRYPDVVCGVHLGIAKGALAEYGSDDAGASLVPFAEPGACLLRLAAPSAG